jgi:hypothetical protein
MSGPVTAADTLAAPSLQRPEEIPRAEIIAGRTAMVGSVPVRRVLPRRPRRTVGAWCFADHVGPVEVSGSGADIGPHPHMGLHTVTWLLDGELLHRDSLGSEQLIRPGQVNLMTAGHGVAHAEESAPGARGVLHGVQLWVAQPEATRHRAAARADASALLALVTHALAHPILDGPAGNPVEVVIIADLDDLSPHAEHPAGQPPTTGSRIADGPGLHPDTVRRLGCDAHLRFQDRTDPETSSARRRYPSRWQRQQLWARDRGCRAPGCTRTRVCSC